MWPLRCGTDQKKNKKRGRKISGWLPWGSPTPTSGPLFPPSLPPLLSVVPSASADSDLQGPRLARAPWQVLPGP